MVAKAGAGPIGEELDKIVNGLAKRAARGRSLRFEPDWEARMLSLAGAVMGAGEGEWALLDWSAFVQAMVDSGASMNMEAMVDGEALVWALDRGLLDPEFSSEHGKTTAFEKISLNYPKVAAAALANPNHWGAWLAPGLDGLRLDGAPERWGSDWAARMAALPTPGFEPPRLG